MKRFSFTVSDNNPLSFIAEGAKSYLVDLSDDLHPQYIVTFGGKSAKRDPETIDAEQYIGKKGFSAKGKKCHERDVAKVRFTEPLHYPEDEGPIDLEIPTAVELADAEESSVADLPEIEEPTLF